MTDHIEEAIEDRYTRMHADQDNMPMRLDRQRYGLTGVWEDDLRAGKVTRTEDAWEYTQPRTIIS